MAARVKIPQGLNGVFGPRRPPLSLEKRSSPPDRPYFPLDNEQDPYSKYGQRKRTRIALLVSKYRRRPVVLVIVVGFLLWFAGVLKDFVFGSRRPSAQKETGESLGQGWSHETAIPQDKETFHPNIDKLLLTVTKTSVVRSTQTVTVSLNPGPTNSAGQPLDLKDLFGFPIISSPSTAQNLEPPTHERASSEPTSSTGEDTDHSAHFYRADGLVEVSPTGPHPIFELIEKAEAKWASKQKKASKTLKEAYVEYQRRYGRRPPKGFDAWWTYVQSNNVQLPDEYDQIDRDLAPFWGIDPVHLRQIQKDWEAHVDSYTIGKDSLKDDLDVLNYTTTENEVVRQEILKGVELVLDVLDEVQKDLRPFRAVFSPHDTPSLPTDWELKEEAKEAAKAGKYIDMKKERDHKLHGWRSSCPPFSPAWIDPLPYTPYPPPLSVISSLKHKTPFSQASSPSSPSSFSSSRPSSPPKTFIYDHKLTMDPCYHPSHLLTHGQFLAHGAGPVPHRSLIPQFSYSPTTMHDDIITAFPLNWVEDILPREDDPPFADKEDSRLHWRGSNTGMWHGGEEVLPYTDHEDPAHSDEHGHGQTNAEGVQVQEKREFVEGQMWWLSQRGRLVDWANKMVEDVVPRSGGSGGNGWWKRSTGDGADEIETGIPIELRPRAPTAELDEDGNPIASTDPLLALSNATLSTRAYPKMKNSASRVLRSTPNRMWAVGEPSVEVPKAKWAPAMADVAYTGEPINCEWYICDKLKQAYEFRKGHDGKAQGRYKYIMDVDGNGWSSRFKRLITSNALIFKSTIYPEWYTDRFQPWVHYVPVQVDLSDLLDTLYFFRGDPSGNNGHPDLAEKIAHQGREWSLTHWRKVDMTAYMFRLFLEYARVMSEQRDLKKDFEVESFEGEGESRKKVKKTEWAGMEDYVYREEDEFYVV